MGSAIDSVGSFVLVVAIVVGVAFVVRKVISNKRNKVE